MTVKKEGEGDQEVGFIEEFKDEQEDLDMDAFLREGGIDLEQLDDQSQEVRQTKAKPVQERAKIVEIVGRENMSGYLFKQETSIEDSSQLFGKIFSTVTDTVNMFADTLNKKRTKRFFRIKNRRLFIYNNAKSDKAEEDIVIKDIEVLNYDEDSKKSFYFLYKRTVFRMEAKNNIECEEWVKSIEMVMAKSEEYLNLDRYVDEKIFTKVSGKSLFKDYETIFQEHRKKRDAELKAKREAEEKIRIEEERKKLEELGQKKAAKVAKKQKKSDVDELPMTKNKSALPQKNNELESNPPQKLPTMTSDTPFRTGPIQNKPPANDVEKAEKAQALKVAAPNIDNRPLNINFAAPAPEIDSDSDSPKGGKTDKTPLLMAGNSSDLEDEPYKNNYNLNASNPKKQPLKPTKTSEHIDDILRMDDERKESMYDIMMKKEVSAKTSISVRREDTKNESDYGYDGDKSRNMSSTTGAKTSMNSGYEKSAFKVAAPKTYVGEPITQSSCFGGCINWITALFRRNN